MKWRRQGDTIWMSLEDSLPGRTAKEEVSIIDRRWKRKPSKHCSVCGKMLELYVLYYDTLEDMPTARYCVEHSPIPVEIDQA